MTCGSPVDCGNMKFAVPVQAQSTPTTARPRYVRHETTTDEIKLPRIIVRGGVQLSHDKGVAEVRGAASS